MEKKFNSLLWKKPEQVYFCISVLFFILICLKIVLLARGASRKNSSAFLLFIFSILKAAYTWNWNSKHAYFKFKILPLPGFRSSADLGLRHFSKFNLLRGHLDDIFKNWVKPFIWTDVSLFCSLYLQITQRMCPSRIFSLRGNTSQNVRTTWMERVLLI